MAHNYVVSSATYIPGSTPDPSVTVVGTVDTIPVTVTIALSLIVNANILGGLPAVKTLAANYMLPQAIINSPATFAGTSTSPAQLPTGSFTQ